MVSIIWTCHRIEDTQLDQQPLLAYVAGTPKNELNKIWMEMIQLDNKEVVQDGVESTVSQLQGGRLVREVDEAARPWYEQVKETKNQRRLIWKL